MRKQEAKEEGQVLRALFRSELRSPYVLVLGTIVMLIQPWKTRYSTYHLTPQHHRHSHTHQQHSKPDAHCSFEMRSSTQLEMSSAEAMMQASLITPRGCMGAEMRVHACDASRVQQR